MIRSKLGQRLMGVVLLAAGIGGTYWEWQTLLTEGYYYPKAAALFPTCAVFSLGLVLLPLDFEQLKADHGVDKPEKFAHYPPEWKVIFFLALAAGLGNWYFLANYVPR